MWNDYSAPDELSAGRVVNRVPPEPVQRSGDSRSIARPLWSKWVMKGPYSSHTQKVPSGRATRPSES